MAKMPKIKKNIHQINTPGHLDVCLLLYWEGLNHNPFCWVRCRDIRRERERERLQCRKMKCLKNSNYVGEISTHWRFPPPNNCTAKQSTSVMLNRVLLTTCPLPPPHRTCSSRRAVLPIQELLGGSIGSIDLFLLLNT